MTISLKVICNRKIDLYTKEFKESSSKIECELDSLDQCHLKFYEFNKHYQEKKMLFFPIL